MKRLEKFLRPYRRESILAPLFKLLEVVFDLMVPVVVAQIIDVGVAKNDRGYIVEMFFVLLLMAAVGLLCSFTAQFFVRSYPETVIYRTGYARNGYADHKTDRRCEPGAEWN